MTQEETLEPQEARKEENAVASCSWRKSLETVEVDRRFESEVKRVVPCSVDGLRTTTKQSGFVVDNEDFCRRLAAVASTEERAERKEANGRMTVRIFRKIRVDLWVFRCSC